MAPELHGGEDRPLPASLVLVDDDGDLILLCTRALSRRLARTVSIVAYSCPVVALDQIGAAAPPDCVVVDMNMPRMSGPDLVASLRQRPGWGGACVYMLSSSDRVEDVDAAFAAGADGYFLKPTGSDGWPAVAERVLGLRRDGNLFEHGGRR